MDEFERDTVYGYVRQNYDGTLAEEIIEIIYKFYLVIISTNILSKPEQAWFMYLLFDRLSQQKQNKNMKFINLELLYRASDYENKYEKYAQLCYDKGPTITIIHNDANIIFGGYTSKSWPEVDDIFPVEHAKDRNAFLFIVRPSMKCIEFRDRYKKTGKEAITSYFKNGPIFGAGWDVYIEFKEDGGIIGGSSPKAFKFKKEEIWGKEERDEYKVMDVELFSITIE